MTPLTGTDQHPLCRTTYVAFVALLFLIGTVNTSGAAEPKKPDSGKDVHVGTFLVATDNLSGSSFQETVILVTHYNQQGTTGIAINRPTTLSLKEAYPKIKRFRDGKDQLFLGGPVRPDTIFVLLKSRHTHKHMQHIAKDIYFAAGIKSMIEGKTKLNKRETARAYAGYTGWAPGQLEQEISNGDWLVIQADVNIIFTEDNSTLWSTLHKAWSGTWI